MTPVFSPYVTPSGVNAAPMIVPMTAGDVIG
jgi:hypothetical protein